MRNLRRITLTVLASAAVIAGLTACDPDDSLSSPASLTTTTDSFARFSAPTTEMQIAAPRKVDPYSTNGRWKVGYGDGQIAPGDYQAAPTDSMGYWETCRNITCEIGTDGFIENDLIEGPDYMNIPADAQYVKLSDITLTPAG